MKTAIRYSCGACGYRWTREVNTRTPIILDRPIEAPDCEACPGLEADGASAQELADAILVPAEDWKPADGPIAVGTFDGVGLTDKGGQS